MIPALPAVLNQIKAIGCFPVAEDDVSSVEM